MQSPRSPKKHYDKYTYSSKRRPESQAENPRYGPHPSNSPVRGQGVSDYQACVAGLAPLFPDATEGFCIAEDGRISSRVVSPPRFGAPSVALVQVPVTITTTRRDGLGGFSTVRTGAVGPNSTGAVALTQTAQGRAQYMAPVIGFSNNGAPSMSPEPLNVNVKAIMSPSRDVAGGGNTFTTTSAASRGTPGTPTRTAGRGASNGASPSTLTPTKYQRQSSIASQASSASKTPTGTALKPYSRTSTNTSQVTSPPSLASQPHASQYTATAHHTGVGLNADEWMSWKKFVSLAAKEFREEELTSLSWEAVKDLCNHYNLTNPVEVARIQLAFKKKCGELLSDSSDLFYSDQAMTGGLNAGGYSADTTVYIPSPHHHNMNSHDSVLVRRPSFASVLSSQGVDTHPSSPRRGIHEPAYVPSHKSPMRWRSPAKVDTGMVKPIEQRAATPTRSTSFAGSTFTPRAKTPTRTPKRVMS